MPDEPLHPETLTWTALLGKWMDFAKAALAQPDDVEGQRWREVTPSIINLQAVTFALGELDQLDADERPVARDKAEITIRQAVQQIEQTWGRDMLPPSLHEIIHDARQALAYSIYAGAVEQVWPGPGTMIMPEVDLALEAGGTLAVMMPGTIVMPGEPVAWWADRPAIRIEGCEQHKPDRPRQVYRQVDIERGRIERDVIAPLDETLPAGMPLLVPLLEEGRRVGEFTMTYKNWLDKQRRAMEREEIPVDDQTA